MKQNKGLKSPPLPIPELNNTMHNYLNRLKSLLSEEEYIKDEKIVKLFFSNSGLKLNEALKDYANSISGSWLHQFWLNSYLENRAPLNGNVSYSTIINTAKMEKKNFPHFCAKLIYIMVNLYFKIANEEIPTEKGPLGPLCLSQFKNIFGSFRIPTVGADTLLINQKNLNNPYIILLYNGNNYVLQVAENGKIYNEDSLEIQVSNILQDDNKEGPNIGVFTTRQRDKAATLRENIYNLNKKNAKNLICIEKSLFTMCIDKPSKTLSKEDLVHSIVFGNGKNRWFDASSQVIVGTDFSLGFTNEHTGYDGSAWIILLKDICDFMETPSKHQLPNGKPNITKLEWDLDNKVQSELIQSEKENNDRGNKLIFKLLHFDRFGAREIKDLKCSPDAFFHLGLQLAWYRLKGKLSNTYEPVSLRQFYQGRTECMRPATTAVWDFVNYKGLDKSKKKELAINAMSLHSSMLKQCRNGNGPERHLFGLKNMIKEDIPQSEDIFNTWGYKILSKDILSTSNLSFNKMDVFAFGPVTEDGFGVGYNIGNEDINVCLSCFSDFNKQNDIDLLSQSLNNAFLDIYNMI